MIRFEHYPTDAQPADIIATYTYDINGRRLKKTVNNVTTHFFWQGDNVIAELDDTMQPIRRYYYGQGMDDVQAQLEYADITTGSQFDMNAWYSLISDQVGTVKYVFNRERNEMTENRFFDTFGNIVNHTGKNRGQRLFLSL